MKKCAAWTLAAAFAIPALTPLVHAQQAESHAQAKADQDAYDREHHNTAKTVGGSAAGGAAVGAIAGGGKGALIGGAIGGAGGAVADKVRKHKGVKQRERGEGKPVDQ